MYPYRRGCRVHLTRVELLGIAFADQPPALSSGFRCHRNALLQEYISKLRNPITIIARMLKADHPMSHTKGSR